jgi:plastocyanin
VSRFASRRALAAVLVAAVLVAGVGQAEPVRAAGGPVTIVIDHFTFNPAEITIEAGTIVEWVNRDQTIHNVIVPAAKVSSPGMDTGDHFTYRFDAPAQFTYLCGLHPHMIGVIHVKAHG